MISARVGFFGATAFSPLSISGLTLWLDASDSSTVTLDSNSRVSAWNDKSGFARHFTKSDANTRARYNVTVNGRNAINAAFADTSGTAAVSRSSASNADLGGSSAATLLMAFRIPTALSAYSVSSFGDAANNLDRFPDGNTYSSRLRSTRASGINMGMPTSGTIIFGTVVNGSTQTWRRQGNQVGSATSAYSSWYSLTGTTWSILAANPNCYWCEIVFYNKALSSTELSQAESYLLQRWAP
jgi:hypothetical protein